MRRALLLLTMAAGFTLVVWAGWHNLKDRRQAAAQQQATRVDLIPSTQADDEDPAASSPLRGKPAPAFTLVDLSGKKVALSDFKGHPLLLNFWATYCEPCKLEMPWLEEFKQKYASNGFEVVGIDYDSEVGKDTVAKNVQKLGVTYPILLSNSKVEDAYLSNTGDVLPISFYVDKAGKIIQITGGVGSKDQLEARVKEIIAAGEN